ncbi:MAG TPA: lipoprotein [Methylibium sp.]|uniref:LPS translocon maturation chaperone LptM n=1 Tax=Methylibium sp. TaxID=2067992 RepID=UPI002DB9059F|nr:lipoprotein [Methylibium sp.]HEU4459185.1 lipoprotein [Methylibium sp.]
MKKTRRVRMHGILGSGLTAFVVGASALLVVTGCGQKGPLVLAPAAKAASAPAAPASGAVR